MVEGEKLDTAVYCKLLPINLPTCIWNGRMRSYMILMRSPILETGLKPVRSCLWKQDKCI